jgi:hypothetical protein
MTPVSADLLGLVVSRLQADDWFGPDPDIPVVSDESPTVLRDIQAAAARPIYALVSVAELRLEDGATLRAKVSILLREDVTINRGAADPGPEGTSTYKSARGTAEVVLALLAAWAPGQGWSEFVNASASVVGDGQEPEDGRLEWLVEAETEAVLTTTTE